MSLRSFRDPDGFVTDDGENVSRTIAPEAADRCREFLASPLYRNLIELGWLVPATDVTEQADGGLHIRHPRVAVPVYPSEWTPSMLVAAAQRTLEIQRDAWREGWTLKDAAANNILFVDGTPVLCDLMSLVRQDRSARQRWVAYGQFVRHFAIPLLLAVDRGIMPREVFSAHRDGLRARDAVRWLPWWKLIQPAVFLHVTLPAWLESRSQRAPLAVDRPQLKPVADSPSEADPVLWTLASLQRLVSRLSKKVARRSVWSDYEQERAHYDASALTHKHDFIERHIQRARPKNVLDIGANTGEYSLLALKCGANVVALDEDAPALDRLFLHGHGRRLGLTCIHANFARPTPATGWQLQESLSLDSRLEDRFDLVIAVAVLHHLIVTERLPLASLMGHLATRCTGTLIIEFVARDDPKFREIAALNLPLYDGWSLDAFLCACAPWFDVIEQETVRGNPTRTLLAMRRRST